MSCHVSRLNMFEMFFDDVYEFNIKTVEEQSLKNAIKKMNDDRERKEESMRSAGKL